MLLLFTLCSALAQESPPSPERPAEPESPAPLLADLILRNARVVDADGAREADVVLKDGRILQVGRSLNASARAELDLAGKTLTPGLIDSHVHTTFATGAGLFDWPEAEEDRIIQHSLRAYVAAGVTTVLDCASLDPELARVQDYLTSGPGPRMLHLGEPPAQPGTYGPAVFPELEVQETTEQLQSHLAHLKDTGSIGVKVLFEDGALRPTWGLPDGEWLDTLVSSAEEQGLPLYVHAMSPEETTAALATHPYVLVHGLWSPDEEVVDRVAAQDPYVIATLHISASALFPVRPEWQTDPLRELLVHPTVRANQEDPAIREQMVLAVGQMATPRLPLFLLKRLGTSTRYAEGMLEERFEATAQLHAKGVKLVVGSDAPAWPMLLDNPPGWSTIREMELLHDAGLTPTEILAAGTSVPAKMLGLEDELGAIRPGMAADLVVMSGDPLTDIDAWRTVTHVIRAGEARTPQEWLSE